MQAGGLVGAVVVRHAQQGQDPQGALYDDDDAPPVMVVSTELVPRPWGQGRETRSLLNLDPAT